MLGNSILDIGSYVNGVLMLDFLKSYSSSNVGKELEDTDFTSRGSMRLPNVIGLQAIGCGQKNAYSPIWNGRCVS
jgi:hypothetical protein